MHSRELMIRIFYQDQSSLTLTCDSAEMLQQRIENIFNVNKQVKFSNRNPRVEKNTFSLTKPQGKEDITVYYTATLDFEFNKRLKISN